MVNPRLSCSIIFCMKPLQCAQLKSVVSIVGIHFLLVCSYGGQAVDMSDHHFDTYVVVKTITDGLNIHEILSRL
ncbi:hypothetical protein B0H12DRAFT_1091626 [Mycena haematopus]|nr:hypothetical protein B0H12DRAFT_1091626 [Mycena haematopus]